MRDVLAAHTGQRDVRYRLRDATESTTSGKSSLWWISGAPAPDFPIGSACCLPQRALSVSGVALTGRGSRSPRHDLLVSAAPPRYASRDRLYSVRREAPPRRGRGPPHAPPSPPVRRQPSRSTATIRVSCRSMRLA